MKFIKILDPILQKELVDMGFNYIIENLGNKQVFAFADSKELRKHILTKYSDIRSVCYFDDKLFF